ncbi:TetR/AcrR family transcriptional regulator [Microbacterium sp. EYE_5]|uniref:TetR/AcrR family transcriptional regulator n=1 Tax=unclassified Microbacterium TaxID=2609290 RepID=UPI002002AAE0|nr:MULTISPECIES: TetR/AcrR family transcriptional regulator [unclassified Microbacterium]MCK6079393.1 TetR/AcrR family transcriptional regulator [Microbacterium sp. EYE_382]MCK6084663.1 TetR/AcrR family transcriptional regulator [Microbacterium sp. EYE_384]MCK6123108.1 TetR/AcrR family transcriptional regulator [Microbacterium sp. EYE_80]MCK6125427.1 TetR/AcrR family transcriptional regulator [Microbacterium sp. EYE_79]MCK6140347.1 TetR/AcrR family transcriptional regulator [Microbacterium sp.
MAESTISPDAETTGVRAAKSERRRRQLLDRALSVFNERGLEGTSLRALGEAIGVSHGALRHYFPSREHLLLEVLREADRRALEFSEESGKGAVDFVLRGADYNMRIPGLMALYNTMAASALERDNVTSREFFVERYDNIRRALVTVFEVGREQGTIRSDISIEDAAALVIAACDGLATQWLIDPQVDMRSAMHLLDRLLGTSSTI